MVGTWRQGRGRGNQLALLSQNAVARDVASLTSCSVLSFTSRWFELNETDPFCFDISNIDKERRSAKMKKAPFPKVLVCLRKLKMLVIKHVSKVPMSMGTVCILSKFANQVWIETFLSFIWVVEIYCRALEKPNRGSVMPSLCTKRFANIRRGTSCKFNCTKGFEMSNGVIERTIKCQANGFWDHSTPSCHRK